MAAEAHPPVTPGDSPVYRVDPRVGVAMQDIPIFVQPAQSECFPANQLLRRLSCEVRKCLIGQHDITLRIHYEQTFCHRVESRTYATGNCTRGVELLQRPPHI